MKKVLFILLISTLANAQNNFRWADSAAVWHHSYTGGGPPGYQKSSYVKDTVINNKFCQKINIECQNAWPQFNAPPIVGSIQNLSPCFLYKSNDSVFIYRNNSFYLSFKTNATIGEIWDLGEFESAAHAYVKVDSVYYQNYNGLNLRNIHVTPCKANGEIVLPTDTVPVSLIGNIINEKFGPLSGFSYLNFMYINVNMYCGVPNYFLCYEDVNFPIINDNGADCFNWILTNSNDIEKNDKIYLYPNPANDRIYFSNNTLYNTLNIYNNIGQLEQTFINSNNSGIDISLLSKGFYTYTITDNKQNIIANGKFIKE